MIRFQQTPDSFFVTEEPLYQPSGEGRYLFLQIRKRDCSTNDAKRRIAEWAGVSRQQIRHGGMKDRAATAIQWLSWEAGSAPLPMEPPPEDIEILHIDYHDNNLSVGHVRANRFRLVLESDGQSLPEDRLSLPYPNLYGPQRFGRGVYDEDSVRERLRKPVKDRMLISTLQSWLFNRFLTERLAGKAWTPDPEELWTTSNGKRVFSADWDGELEERFHSGEVMPTGPIFGYKIKTTGSERAWLAGLQLETEDFRPWGKLAKGARRPLLVKPEIHRAEALADRMELEFSLPSGAYATIYLLHLFMPDMLWQPGSQWPDFTEPVLLS